jgi:hypothetical protein
MLMGEHVGDVKTALNEGHCLDAYESIKAANRWWGNASGHNRGMPPRDRDFHDSQRFDLADTEDRFEAQCVRPRASVVRGFPAPTAPEKVEEDPVTKRFKLLDLDGGRRRRRR